MSGNLTLKSLPDTFFGKGEPCNYGCPHNELDNIWNKVRGYSECKSVFAVRDWVWLDVEMDGKQFSIVKADSVVKTSSLNLTSEIGFVLHRYIILRINAFAKQQIVFIYW